MRRLIAAAAPLALVGILYVVALAAPPAVLAAEVPIPFDPSAISALGVTGLLTVAVYAFYSRRVYTAAQVAEMIATFAKREAELLGREQGALRERDLWQSRAFDEGKRVDGLVDAVKLLAPTLAVPD